MTFEKYFSSSRGNLYTVTAESGHRLMVECGVPWRRLEKALKYNLEGIDACLVTHDHQDHCQAVEDVLKAGIPVYASEGTLKAIEDSLHLQRHVTIIRGGERFAVDSAFEVFPFAVHHDAAEPLGFIIYEKATGEDMLFATDTSHLTQRFALAFSLIAIEASYDREILKERVDSGAIHLSVAKRLLDSHQEWRVAKRYLMEFCDLSRCRQIVLIHPSGENLNKRHVRQDIEDSVFVKTVI